MINRTAVLLGIMLGLSGLARPTWADRRMFVWTYQYLTMPRGEAEIEHYLTTKASSGQWGNPATELQMELEVGMNDRFDAALYQVFTQFSGGGLRYSAFKLRTRYRTGDLGGSWAQPVLYLEVKTSPDFGTTELEFKPIYGKSYPKWEVAVNPVVELANPGGEWAWKYAVGAAYRLDPLLGLGVEATGSESGHYLGPVLSHGRDDLWMALGAGFKMGSPSGGAPSAQVRLLVGIAVAKPEPSAAGR